MDEKKHPKPDGLRVQEEGWCVCYRNRSAGMPYAISRNIRKPEMTAPNMPKSRCARSMVMVLKKPMEGMLARNLAEPVWSVVAQRARPMVAFEAYLAEWLANLEAYLAAEVAVR
jgi:hypothetical protein